MPAADAGSWANRASRRKQRERYRLAFIASKFRIAEEPEPFILEIDTTADPWTVMDVTDLVDREGAAARLEKAKQKVEAVNKAADLLLAGIWCRLEASQPPMLKGDAELFLKSKGFSRKLTREVIDNPNGRSILVEQTGVKGHPVALVETGKNHNGGGKVPNVELATNAVFDDARFRRPHAEPTAEIDPSQTREKHGDLQPAISAKDSLLPLPTGVDGGEGLPDAGADDALEL